MYTPEFYTPGTSDSPKKGRRPVTDRRKGTEYLMPQNPFLEVGGLIHAEIPTPEEALLRREEEGEEIWSDQPEAVLPQEDETSQEDVWMDFAPFAAEDLNDPTEELDFGPPTESTSPSRIDRNQSRKGGERHKSPNIAQINRDVVMTTKRKSSEKRKAA